LGVGLITMLSACAVPFISDHRENEDRPVEATTARPSAIAVAHLSNNAEQAISQKRYEEAVDLLERAIRIEPGNPELWYLVAEVRYEQGLYDQAIQLANRSIALSENNSSLMKRNQRLIKSSQKKLED